MVGSNKAMRAAWREWAGARRENGGIRSSNPHATPTSLFCLCARRNLLRDLLRLMLGERRDKQVEALSNFGEFLLLGDGFVPLHALLPKALLATLFDLLHAFHCAHRRLHELTVVLDRTIAQALEIERAVHSHLLACRLPESLSPSKFAWVELVLKCLVAFTSTKLEDLGVVTHECDAVARIARARADVACFNTHRNERSRSMRAVGIGARPVLRPGVGGRIDVVSQEQST
mmetsp:Transcript_8240/g.19302  ORF Transcript_8240/g.19302 Transcript_8240/m.19302 type:complete len:231 (-) Transcript_8240:10-702(-)